MRGVRGYAVLIILLVGLSAARLAAAQGRALYWRELGVTASLDREGRLHVEERHAMLFWGDWNGGERRFRLSEDQTLELRGLARLTEHGQRIPLTPGDLSEKDQYAFSRSKSLTSRTLRWRSRQPQEPAFDKTELVYVISYVLSDVLVPRGDGRYRLDHDFAFPDRPGLIERFTLDFEVEPVWRADAPVPLQETRGPLVPGSGAVTTLDLLYTGAGAPSAVIDVASRPLRYICAAALLGIVGGLLLRLFRRERALGRLAPPVPLSSVDEPWLARHVFSMSPELVGTVYDREVTSTEVAAVIARMQLEGKLASRVTASASHAGEDNLELWLLATREALEGYERALVDKLFFSGNATSTDAVRAHYKGVGFNPAKLLRSPLQKQARELLGTRSRPAEIWLLVLCFALSCLGLVGAVVARFSQLPVAVLATLTGSLGVCVGVLFAYPWAADVERPARVAIRFVAPLGVLTLICLGVILLGESLSSLSVASFALAGATSAGLVLRLASSKDEYWGIALRRHVRAARRYFEHELQSPMPRIRDEWYPYLIALGLRGDMDKWFLAFGGPEGSSYSDSVLSRSSSSSGSTAPSPTGAWSGGGGAFGGAGASGSWMSAAGALTTGVSSHSGYSSGSSGGSSSSSSSGGGGGGGW